MNAMTWWDWESQCVWSQPWGAAIDGELTGTRLNLLPSWFPGRPGWNIIPMRRCSSTNGSISRMAPGMRLTGL